MCQRWVRAGPTAGSFGLPAPACRARSRWQVQREGAPGTRARRHLDVAPVLPGQLPSEVEPEPGAGDAPVLRRQDPAETREQPGKVLAGDPQAAVAHGHARVPGVGANLAAHLAAVRRVLD